MFVLEKHECAEREREPRLCCERNVVRLTEFDTIISEKVPREYHLPEAEARAKGREKADGEDAQDVDADDGQCRVNEAEPEDGLRQGSQCKG